MVEITNSLYSMTQSLEDYLEMVYFLMESNKVARVKDLSARLGVKMSSVNTALKALDHRGYIIHEKYGYIELTDPGRREAEKIIRKHRMLMRFFNEVLGVGLETSERDACRVEHYLSDETIAKMERYLAGGGRAGKK